MRPAQCSIPGCYNLFEIPERWDENVDALMKAAEEAQYVSPYQALLCVDCYAGARKPLPIGYVKLKGDVVAANSVALVDIDPGIEKLVKLFETLSAILAYKT